MVTSYQLQRRIGHNSSRVTKGKQMFVELGDTRSAWARRWNDLVLRHASDLGGYDMLSEAQISICRRAATLECELESMEGRKSAGMPIEIEVYGRLAGRLRRMLELIGTKPPDALTELAKAFEGYPPTPPPNDDEDEEDERA